MPRPRVLLVLAVASSFAAACGNPIGDTSAGPADPPAAATGDEQGQSAPSPMQPATEAVATPAPPSGEFVNIGTERYEVVRSCRGNPVIGVTTLDAFLAGPSAAVLEVWADEGAFGLYLQFEPGGPVWKGDLDPDGTPSTGTASLTSPSGETTDVSYALYSEEPCEAVLLREVSSAKDENGGYSGPYLSLLDICSGEGGAFTAWLNEGVVVNLTLEGMGEGAFGAVVDSALGDQSFTTIGNNGEWYGVSAGGLMGEGRVYRDGFVGKDDRFLEFGFPGAMIRACDG